MRSKSVSTCVRLKTKAALHDRLATPKSPPRRAYVGHFVDAVITGEAGHRIQGSNATLEVAAWVPETILAGEVPSSVQDWRREGDWDSIVSAFVPDHTTV